MLGILWFAVKTAALIAIAIWFANRPGYIDISWLGYDIHIQVGFALLLLFGALLVTLALYRLYLFIANIPANWRRYRERRALVKGQRALMLGMAAVAAGDRKLARYHAFRARKLMPKDTGLTVMLEAEAARLNGEELQARDAYDRLMENKDTVFLGMRGLLSSALDRGDTEEAMTLAEKALAIHPKQPWILDLAYRLEIRQRRWDRALTTLRKIEKLGPDDGRWITRDRQAILLQQAADAFENAQDSTGLNLLKQAYRLDISFVPAAVQLADRYLIQGQRRAAAKIVGKSWAVAPHPDLARLWGRLAPVNKPNDVSVRLRWFEKLVTLRPDSAESQLAAAQAALDDRLWGEARQYLSAAESLKSSARLFRLRADLEDHLGHTAEARRWREKAVDAPADPVWTCRETGRIYERWTPIALPHGAFNTIQWDYPAAPRAVPQDMLDRASLTMLPPTRFGGFHQAGERDV